MIDLTRRQILKASSLLAFAPNLLNSQQPTKKQVIQHRFGPYADAALVTSEPPPIEEGSFTIAVLPDTQHYSELHPETFIAQTNWIVEQQRSRNIACVLHLGDVTNHNTPVEWDHAVKAMRVLDGKVPYFIIPGNHDYSTDGHCCDRTTLFSEYFSVEKFQNRPTFGGVYDKEPDRMENNYHLFSEGEKKFLILGLEFGPRKDVLRWANQVVDQHSDRQVILITHALIYFDETRYNWKKFGASQAWNPHSYPIAKVTADDVCDGEELWNGLISRHENFILTLNGHVLGDGLGRIASRTPGGRDVTQLLVNFQMRPRGGDGWLRLLEFRPDGKTVQVYDYSPTRKQLNESRQNQFRFRIPQIPANVG